MIYSDNSFSKYLYIQQSLNLEHLGLNCPIVDEHLEVLVSLIHQSPNCFLYAVSVRVFTRIFRCEIFYTLTQDVIVEKIEIYNRWVESKVIPFGWFKGTNLMEFYACISDHHFAQVAILSPKRIKGCNLRYFDAIFLSIIKHRYSRINKTETPIRVPFSSIIYDIFRCYS